MFTQATNSICCRSRSRSCCQMQLEKTGKFSLKWNNLQFRQIKNLKKQNWRIYVNGPSGLWNLYAFSVMSSTITENLKTVLFHCITYYIYEEHVLFGLNQIYYWCLKCTTCYHYTNIIKSGLINLINLEKYLQKRRG